MTIRSVGVVIFLAGLVFSACQRIKPKPPEPTSLDSLLSTPLSTLIIPLEYEVEHLQSMINDKVQGVFIHEWFKLNDKGDSLYLEVEKKGTIKLDWRGTILYSTLPFKVSGKFKKRIAGINIRNSQPVSTEFVLHLSTSLGLSKKWALEPHTTIEKIDWVKDPVLKVGIIKINLHKLIVKALDDQKDKLIVKLDQAISSQLDTRKEIQKCWIEIQKPILVNKKGVKVWLKAEAKNINARFIDRGKTVIAVELELSAFIQTLLEGEPIPPSQEKLPPFKKTKSIGDSLQMYVLSKISFSKINEILNAQLVGQKIEAEGYSTKIKEIEVYGIKNGLAVRCKVSGDVKGQLYAHSFPVYDTIEDRLWARDFNYDIDTENALLNSADWLLKEDALDIIKDKLQIELRPYIDQLPNLIEQGIAKGKVGEKISLSVKKLDVKPRTILITKSDIQILFEAHGKASINVQQEIFAKKKAK